MDNTGDMSSDLYRVYKLFCMDDDICDALMEVICFSLSIVRVLLEFSRFPPCTRINLFKLQFHLS